MRSLQHIAAIGLFVAGASCASDVAEPTQDWQLEERALPVPPAQLDQELVWHHVDETAELREEIGDVWDEDTYRIPLMFIFELSLREFYDDYGDSMIVSPRAYVGFGEPFFADGRIHMLEIVSVGSRSSDGYRLGRLEFVETSFGVEGHVLYEPGTEPRTEPYERKTGDDLPEPLATWMEAGGRPMIDLVVYRPDLDLWFSFPMARQNCRNMYSCYFAGPGPYRNFFDPRILYFKAGSRYQILNTAPE